jgi:predicted ATP-grasp superfamily ATP-dependent carboligase
MDRADKDGYLDEVLRIGRTLGRKSILIPTSDELSIFVAEKREILREYFLFPDNSAELIEGLADKRSMYKIALAHDIPTPRTEFPQNEADVRRLASELRFPVMFKAIRGELMQRRTGIRMKTVHSREELLADYAVLEDPHVPNVMLQELIPGADDQVYIFNGYFDRASDCLVGFTGHKLRQFPVHKGCASLGVCTWNQEVADQTVRLMKAVGYQGILDIGYRLDPRDGKYKVLDINPRVGQAFRLFVAENDMDVVRSLYLDLTGQPQQPSPPQEGRRWLIEDYDLVSSLAYFREGTLKPMDWLLSMKGVKETAWFDARDPVPALVTAGRFSKRLALWTTKHIASLAG